MNTCHSIRMVVLLIISCLSPQVSNSQDLLLFYDASSLLTEDDISGPICRAFADVNGDYRDDIIRFNGRNNLTIDLNSNNGTHFLNNRLDNIAGITWTISIGDLDNNGLNDIITAGAFNGMSRWLNTSRQLDFEKQENTTGDFLAQASNIVDINNDGWLDVFICNDVGLSKIYINQGDGQLIEQNDYINMVTAVPSDNSGNYSSEWTDIDGDGDLDMYIAKCRINVTAFDDPRRINVLYINDNGEFTEQAQKFGIASGAQSWTGNFGDIDNDGDLDLFQGNHDFPTQLFENIENDTFVEIDILGDGTEINNYPLQSAFFDLNNDGFLDIIVGGNKDYILVNNKDNSFTMLENPFGIDDITSFAVGDMTNDGFLDVIASYTGLGENPSKADKLFANLTNENNYIGISLRGIESNASGIGSRIDLYGEWGVQTRILQSGIGYGVTHSLRVNFGIDEAPTIDSLVITWPSGHIDSYHNPDINQYYVATEDACLEKLFNINNNTDLLDCINSEVLLTSQSTFEPQWPDGSQQDSIITSDPGIYSAIFQSEENCFTSSQTILIDSLESLDKPELNISGEAIICDGDSILLSTRDDGQSMWSDGSQDPINYVSLPGSYFAVNSNYCDTVYSDTLTLSSVNELWPLNDSTIILTESPSSIELDPDHESVSWYADALAETLIQSSSTLELIDLETDTTLYYTIHYPDLTTLSYKAGVQISKLSDDNSMLIPTASVSTDFEVNQECLLESVSVLAERAGLRRINLREKFSRDLIFSKDFMCTPGTNKLILNANLETGQYFIETDRSVNLSEYSSDGPALYLMNEAVDYPYSLANIGQITASNLGSTIYGYFFDWQISTLPSDCVSELYNYSIIFDFSSSTESVERSDISLYPNPALNVCNILSDELPQLCIIQNMNGQIVQVFQPTNKSFTLDISDLNEGYYIISLLLNKEFRHFKLLKK